MFYFIIRWVSLAFAKLCLWFKVEGREHVPAKGAFIFAANHSSYLDPFLLTASTSRPLHFITRAQILAPTLLGWVFKHANAIPMKGHGKDLSVIKKSLRLLADGKAIAISPKAPELRIESLKERNPASGCLCVWRKFR